MKQRRWHTLVVLLVCLITGLGVATGTAGAAEPGRHTYTGALDGADYRVETPRHWNGTLILFSHGYVPAGIPIPPGVPLANRAETEQWLLDHGYALAGSDFQGRVGMVLDKALDDQLALLDWFDSTIGKPRRTIASGLSMGGGIATRLAERYPGRFDGVLSISAGQDMQATMNRGLDVTFAVRTLLTDDQRLELVKAADPGHSVQVLRQAVQQALTTPAGRAKLALAGAIGGLPGWASAHQPQPADPVERIRQQEWWIESAYIVTLGPQGRSDIERRAGGNPSFNVGVDYTAELARSGQRDDVEQAYRAAGADVRDDLRRLADAPRIAPDPPALRWMYRFGVTAGTTPTPVVTLHGIAEGIVSPDARWYGERVRVAGHPDRLRQLYVGRGDHDPFSTADEVLALRTLLDRVETGRWPDTSPNTLNAQAATFTPQQQTVFDIFTSTEQVRPPAFTDQRPPRALRPSL